MQPEHVLCLLSSKRAWTVTRVDFHFPVFVCRIFANVPEVDFQTTWKSGRDHCYALAAKLFSHSPTPLPASLDTQSLLGHLLHTCQQASDLQAPPTTAEGDCTAGLFAQHFWTIAIGHKKMNAGMLFCHTLHKQV